MKKSFFLIIVLLKVFVAFGQPVDNRDSIALYFQEIKINTAIHKDLWNLDLYGPILLVDQVTRKVFANYPDSAGILKKDGSIFSGYLPVNINTANTSLRWSGRDWAMIILPLPDNNAERLDLLSHELFHRSQLLLGFHIKNADNNHLDTRDGRIYLRLELEALRQALVSPTGSETIENLSNAMFFRKTRYSLFANAAHDENLLELNEGIADYTGIMMSGRQQGEMIRFLQKKLDGFKSYPTFVRSFAYMTTPVYGYLLGMRNKFRNREINDSTDLTDYFIKAFDLKVPLALCQECMDQYGYSIISDEETHREEAKEKLLAGYRKIFIDESHLVIKFEKMNISFDPRNLVPLGEEGTVYPTMRISDNWGVLTVNDGALLGSNWDKVILSEPVQITQGKVTGKGWMLELNKAYLVKKNLSDNNYSLIKN